MEQEQSTLLHHKGNNWRFFRQLQSAISLCELCQEATYSDFFLCRACQQQLPFVVHPCVQCGEPLSAAKDSPSSTDSHQRIRCGRCQSQPPAYDYSHCNVLYRPPVSIWIQQLKDKRQLIWAKKLAALMLDNPPDCLSIIDALVYIPSSRRRLLYRGFNPAELLAQHISQQTRLPLLHGTLRKAAGQDQRKLGSKERLLNIQRSLTAGRYDLSAMKIMIIDDVMTTGTTLDIAARALKKQGAASVGAWVLARTPPI